MRAPTLYILTGLPFAGKSTLARALAQARALEHLDHVELDAINTAFGVGLAGVAITPEQWERTYAESYRRVERALAAGRDALYDATNYTRAQRDHLRTIAARHGASARVIYVEVPPEVATERWRQNRQSGQRYDVRDDNFQNVLAPFKPPDEDEQVLRYTSADAPAAWIERHLSHRLDISRGRC